jgi:DHA1 family bicyclomycin/chloramphenicol resistance-like MFS transporter
VDQKLPKVPADLGRLRASPWKLLALLMAMTAIGPLSMNILVPALPGLMTTLSTDAGMVQLTVSLFLLGLAGAQLVLGPLSDRFGRRPVALAGMTLTVLSSVSAIAAESIGALIAARIIQALGASTGMVIGRAIIRDLYDRDRAASMIGWVTTAMVVAPMVAPLIGGLLDTALGWPTIFVFVSLCSSAVLAWAAFALPETKPDHITVGGVAYIFGEARALVSSRSFIGYVLCGTVGSGTFFAFLGGAPYIVIGLMGRTSAEYGFWFAFSAFGYMSGNFLAARLSGRLGVRKMIALGVVFEFVGAAIALGLTPLFMSAGPAPMFLPQWLIALGNGMLLPNSTAGAISVRPHAAGTASGITGFTQLATGAVLAQAMSHFVVSTGSPWPLQITIFVLAIMLAGVFWWMEKTRR